MSSQKQRRKDRQKNGPHGKVHQVKRVDEEVEETAYDQLLSLLSPRKKRRRAQVSGELLPPHSDQELPHNDQELPHNDQELPHNDQDLLHGDEGMPHFDQEHSCSNPEKPSEPGDDGEFGASREISDDDGEGSSAAEDESTIKDLFKEHFDVVLSSEEVASLEVGVTTREVCVVSPPSHVPPLGLVSYRSCLPGRERGLSCHYCPLSELKVKRRLSSNWTNGQTSTHFSDLQRHLFHYMNSYMDVMYSQRTSENADEIRRVYILHILNHVLKTRARVLKNNRRLLQASKEGRTLEERRDQGLTRPKVLILLPFRHSALLVVNTLISLLLAPGQGLVHNQRRFRREFGSEVEVPSRARATKPSSYTTTFSGNTDDCFKVGVAVRGKVVRLYADFYSSDIIVASPLGLRTVIGAEGEKGDHDYLSSVEILVLDQSEIFLMQNWEHLTHVLDHLHKRPSEDHGVDFSRVRLWALNECSHLYRQTLIFSSFQTPEINSLLTSYCHNYAGGVQCEARGEEGSVGQVIRQLPQVFTRLTSPSSYTQLSDSRLKHFTNQVLSSYHGDLMRGTLVFIPSYFDFVRVRNHMRKQELSFTVISEYTTQSRVTRARTQFFQGIIHILLYTERAHFFHRYRLRGVHHVLVYSPPIYPEHYCDVVNMVEGEGGTVEVLFSHWEQLALARVVGHSRAQRMTASTDTTHMLVTGLTHKH